MKELNWVVFTETSSGKKSETVCQKLISDIPFEFSPIDIKQYDKGGCRCSLTMEMPIGKHEEQVVAALAVAQQVAYSWTLTGDVAEAVNLWCSDPAIPGVTAIEIQSS